MADDIITCEEKYAKVEACRIAVKEGFGQVMTHIRAVLNGIEPGDSMSEITAKLNVVCEYTPKPADWGRLSNKGRGIFNGMAGKQSLAINKCVNLVTLFNAWAQGLLGINAQGQQNPVGSILNLCDNITGDTFAEKVDCGGAGAECISGLSTWTLPSYCMKDVYKLSPNYQGVDDTTTGRFVVELTPTASSLLSTGCDGDYTDLFGAMDGVDEMGNPIVPACRGTLEYLIQAAQPGLLMPGSFDGSEGKIYLEGKESYNNIQEKTDIVMALIPKMIEAYKSMIEDFLKIIDVEVETAKTNSGKWLTNLKKGLADFSKTIEKQANSTIQNVVFRAFTGGAGAHARPNGPAICPAIINNFVADWGNKRNASNACIQKLMDTTHPTCRVKTTQYFDAAALSNAGANFDDCVDVVSPECFGKAADLIKKQGGVQCQTVKIISISVKDVEGVPHVTITYEFAPVVVWDRGKIEAAGCNNGNIASYMGDMVKILNLTRTPKCGTSPLEYLVVTSQDLGRPIKRIGVPGGTRPEAVCEYTWPNATDQNFGGDGNGPTNPECDKGASPTNCLQLPSIFSETELDSLGEFFLVMSIVLNQGGLMLKTEGDSAAAIWKRMRSSISNFANVRLNTANFEDCRNAGIE